MWQRKASFQIAKCGVTITWVFSQLTHKRYSRKGLITNKATENLRSLKSRAKSEPIDSLDRATISTSKMSWLKKSRMPSVWQTNSRAFKTTPPRTRCTPTVWIFLPWGFLQRSWSLRFKLQAGLWGRIRSLNLATLAMNLNLPYQGRQHMRGLSLSHDK